MGYQPHATSSTSWSYSATIDNSTGHALSACVCSFTEQYRWVVLPMWPSWSFCGRMLSCSCYIGKRYSRSLGAEPGITPQRPLVSVTDQLPSVPRHPVLVENVGVVDALFDTGAAVNAIDMSFLSSDIKVFPDYSVLLTAHGESIPTGGKVKLKITVFGRTSVEDFVVIPNCVCPLILGYNWCAKTGLFSWKPSTACSKTLPSDQSACHEYALLRRFWSYIMTSWASYAFFLLLRLFWSNFVLLWASSASYGASVLETLLHKFLQSSSVQIGETWDIHIAATTVLQPETAMWIKVRSNPPHLNGDIVCEASRISKPGYEVAVPRTLTTSIGGHFSILMMNLGHNSVTLQQGHYVGKSFPLTPTELLTAAIDQPGSSELPSKECAQIPWDLFQFVQPSTIIRLNPSKN